MESKQWTEKQWTLTSDLNLARTEVKDVKEIKKQLEEELSTLNTEKAAELEEQIELLKQDKEELNEKLANASKKLESGSATHEKEIAIIQ